MASYVPAVPFGYDTGLLDGFASQEEMEQFGQMLEHIGIESPYETLSSYATWAEDVVKSPGRSSLQPSSNNSSRSAGTGSVTGVLTPTSTLHDFHGDLARPIEDPEPDNSSTSPESNISPSSDDFVHVRRFGGEPSNGRKIGDRPPLSSSGVSSSTPAYRSRQSSAAPSFPESRPQWLSIASATSGGWMDQSNAGHVDFSAELSFTDDGVPAMDNYQPDLLDDIDSFEDSDNTAFGVNLSFRSTDNGSQAHLQSTYLQASPFAPPTRTSQAYTVQRPPVHQQTHVQHGVMQYDMPLSEADYVSRGPSIPTAASREDMFAAPRSAGIMHIAPHQRGSIAATVPSTTPAVSPALQRARRAPYPPPPGQRQQAPAATRSRYHPHAEISSSASAVMSSVRPLQPAVAGSSRQSAVLSSQSDRSRKGGRQKHSHLPEGTRNKSHRMRKAGACWRCALQRDPCPDENTPCQRCIDKSSKGQFKYFACDRSKLPDFVYDFLPPSMTLMHQKQTIEDCVSDQVRNWDEENSVDVWLTSGYGPALRWKLYEFTPRSNELLEQFQYFQDVNTGTSYRLVKYSPPLGLRKLDTSDDAHFDRYLTQLLDPRHLWEFGTTCFEEETQIDGFQATLMDHICNLYMNTSDLDLRELLAKVIRMMIITYIMGHTLTIEEKTVYGVWDAIQHSAKPTFDEITSHTSPRLANRQLKFFFCILRTQMIENILNWSQQTLHSSSKKETTWLPSFCVMLGLAMAIEELQRTLHIQADAKSFKLEMTAEAANIEAINACERMDERYRLLVGLFQCKYRDKKWGANGSFGNGTPELADPASVYFLQQLLALVRDKHAHLESRRDVKLAAENQCLYTSRLVATFLVPFLGLPP